MSPREIADLFRHQAEVLDPGGADPPLYLDDALTVPARVAATMDVPVPQIAALLVGLTRIIPGLPDDPEEIVAIAQSAVQEFSS
jgi:hypothetical protein